ncbi:class I SAM-dependent methyltransferase [Intrasporangium sp. YIM S08009]|uniref:class I SAM-dependent methyltransferase n=1 Tax=Intrasporangium zincisolvens TaxID=3080018 RepID=UPI002B05DB56|nr:class I SAM-dependent methyltransferase [Intrasporangium sp. YIM S08009]
MGRDWDERAGVLAAKAYATGDPNAWFDRLYGEGVAGSISMPWDRDSPHPLLSDWGEAQAAGARDGMLWGEGRRALVVGCGLGADAEYLASLGFATTAFDLSPNAVATARSRHPESVVDYRVADLLSPPAEWAGAFDLVVEIFTIQAMPDPPRSQAIPSITGFVAPSGTLFAVAFRADGDVDATDGPPFALSAATLRSLGGDRLVLQGIESPRPELWRAVFIAPRLSR